MTRAWWLAASLLGFPITAPAAGSDEMLESTVSEAHATPSGSWRYTLTRSSRYCNGESGAKCLRHVVSVDNQSGETLVCQVRVDFKRGSALVKSFEGPVLVLPRTRPEVNSTLTEEAIEAEVAHFDCLARAPYQRIPKVEGCRYDMMGKPFETYYPAEAKMKSQQGPVIVSFLLVQRLGPAQEINIAESSLVPLLDDAALRFIRDQDFRTTCPGQRFDVLMRFKLSDLVATGPSN